MKHIILSALVFASSGCLRPDLTLVKICDQACEGEVDLAAELDLTAPADAPSPADLLPPPPDLSDVAGCANQVPGSTALGPRAAACAGKFVAGGAAARCAAGWSLCTSYALIDQTITVKGGFFAAEAPAYWQGTMATEMCNTSVTNQLLYGIAGPGFGRPGVKKCGGFPSVLDLFPSWTSANGTLAQAANPNDNSGVLCCR